MGHLVRKLFDRGVVVAATGLLVLAGLLLLGVVSPLFDLLNSGAPLVGAGALCLMLLSLMASSRPRRMAMALSSLALVACAPLLGPELWAAARPSRAVAVPGRTIRILDHNLWAENVDVPGTVAAIRSAHADILFLQERYGRSMAVTEALAADYPFSTDVAGRSGDVILSRFPIVPGNSIGPALNGLKLAQNVVWGVVAPPGQPPFLVATTHYGHPDPGSPQQYQRRSAELFLGQFNPASAIFTGDFNLTPWSFRMRRQDRDLKLQRRTLALPTWPSRLPGAHPFPFPILPIDHVYAGSDWKLVSVERGPRTGSDHFPVIVTLTR